METNFLNKFQGVHQKTIFFNNYAIYYSYSHFFHRQLNRKFYNNHKNEPTSALQNKVNTQTLHQPYQDCLMYVWVGDIILKMENLENVKRPQFSL